MAGHKQKEQKRQEAVEKEIQRLVDAGQDVSELVVKRTKDYAVVVSNARKAVYRPKIDSTDPHERRIAFALNISLQPKVDMTDPDAVRNRADWYFGLCAENTIRPTMSGLAAAFGFSANRLGEIRNGSPNVTKVWSVECIQIMENYIHALEVIWADGMESGSVNPVVSIFTGKNFYGMRDQREHIVGLAQPVQAPAELEKLAAALPDDE